MAAAALPADASYDIADPRGLGGASLRSMPDNAVDGVDVVGFEASTTRWQPSVSTQEMSTWSVVFTVVRGRPRPRPSLAQRFTRSIVPLAIGIDAGQEHGHCADRANPAHTEHVEGSTRDGIRLGLGAPILSRWRRPGCPRPGARRHRGSHRDQPPHLACLARACCQRSGLLVTGRCMAVTPPVVALLAASRISSSCRWIRRPSMKQRVRSQPRDWVVLIDADGPHDKANSPLRVVAVSRGERSAVTAGPSGGTYRSTGRRHRAEPRNLDDAPVDCDPMIAGDHVHRRDDRPMVPWTHANIAAWSGAIITGTTAPRTPLLR